MASEPVEILQQLANLLRGMQYSGDERAHGEVDTSYRNGWNDAMRAAVRSVEGRLSTRIACSCGWGCTSAMGPEAERMLRLYVACPKCRSKGLTSAAVLR